ncbi:MAG TPA: hypothetical protein VGI10_21510 [Polyangiaceae bacterium]
MGFRSKLLVASCTLLASCALLASCTHARPQPASPFAKPPPLPGSAPGSAPGKLVSYRLAPSTLAKSPFASDEGVDSGILLSGVRAAMELSGLTLANTVTEPQLQGGARIPDFQGSGFLFWNQHALYRADTFLGQLKPLATLGFQPSSVSFGPNFALIWGVERQRVAFDLRAKNRMRAQPPFLVDIAAHDHRALALLEDGRVVFSLNSGKSYAPLAMPGSEVAVNVLCEGDDPFVVLESGSRLRLTAANTFIQEQPTPRPPADPAWPFADSPLERALQYGVPLAAGQAGVAVRGAVATLDLASGALVGMARAIAPSELDCRLLDVAGPGSPLMACSSSSNGTVLFADVLGERPREVLRFPAEARMDVASGVFLVEGRCDGTPSATSVCVRGQDGAFVTYDVAKRLPATVDEPAPAAPARAAQSDAVASSPSVARWIPKQGGGALGVVLNRPGLIDAQTGAFAAFKPEFADKALYVLAVQWAKAPKKPPKQASPGTSWLGTPEGELLGWQAGGAVTIARDGRVMPGIITFKHLITADTRAFAVDGAAHTFQSLDHGRSWSETLAPPGFEGRYSLAGHCSAVGCQLGPWLREGWQVEAPLAPPRPTRVEAPPVLPALPTPELSCAELGPPTTAEKSAPTSDATDPADGLGFGAALVPLTRGDKTFFRTRFEWGTVHPEGSGETRGLRAFAYGEQVDTGELAAGQPIPANFLGLSRQRTFSYVAPFDPRATPLHAALDLKSIVRAELLAGADPSEIAQDDDSEFSTLPVLARGVAATDGLLALDSAAIVWLHEPAGAEAFSLAGDLEQATVTSAIAGVPRTLTALIATSDGTSSVIELKDGRARRLFALPRGPYPANPDALALGPAGALAIVRSRSGSEPATMNDPALLLRDGAPPAELPAWSTVELADTPACAEAADDYRVLLQTTGNWLRLIDSGVAVAENAGMFALARVNQQRWCLEALELAHDDVSRGDGSNPSRLVARFAGKNKGAARVALVPGFELRQSLACSIKH